MSSMFHGRRLNLKGARRDGRGRGEEGPLQADYFTEFIQSTGTAITKGLELQGSDTFFLGLVGRLCRRQPLIGCFGAK